MTASLQRIGAIVSADVKIRFRRLSTLVIFLLLSALAYVWVPSPATGRALLQINGQRALYNSAAVGMGTASLAAVFIGLVGFYVVSNAIGRDARSRCGFIIASTNVGSLEYLAGKFLGNVLFLVTFTTGFMLSSMTMLLIRGEAPLQPLVFAKQYVLLVPTTLVLVSALALLFESVPLLSGRFGDVAYFFVWAMMTGLAVHALETGGSPSVWGAFDASGLGFLIGFTKAHLHTSAVSIGAADFDPRKGVFVFQGLSLDRAWILPRVEAMLMPLPVIVVARGFFHRFDPVRVKQSTARHGHAWLSRINLFFKPLTRAAMSLAARGSGPSLFRSSLADALLTMTATPVLALVMMATSFAAAFANPKGVLMVVTAAIGIAIADVSCRESRAGATALAYASPLLKPRFVAFKLLSAGLVVAPFVLVPLFRTAVAPLLAGTAFLVAAATFCGIVSGNAKTFIVLFLSFWYMAVNDKGATPWLDFAGFNGAATTSTTAGYFAAAIALAVAAHLVHAARVRRA